jgi:hypothetical protein
MSKGGLSGEIARDARSIKMAKKTRACEDAYPLFSTALAAYSTWKTLPSGENVVDERSYCNWMEGGGAD